MAMHRWMGDSELQKRETKRKGRGGSQGGRERRGRMEGKKEFLPIILGYKIFGLDSRNAI